MQTGVTKSALSYLEISQAITCWKYFFFCVPILLGILGYSVHLTGDLYGDELATYRYAHMPQLDLSNPERGSTSLIFLKLSALGATVVEAPWGIRLSSVCFAAAMILMTGLLARLLMGEPYQWLAMLITACSPMLVEFGGEARPYAMMVFWSTTFFVCLIRFERHETWMTASLLAIVAILGCLTRMIFAANLAFGAIYYLAKRKQVTGFAILTALLVAPVLLRVVHLFHSYGKIVPKITGEIEPVSTLNFILRTLFALNFGYCTFAIPELGVARNVPILDVLQANMPLVSIMAVAFVGMGFGAFRFAKQQPETFIFVLAAIMIPSAGIIVTGQMGYTILREKFLIGSLGVYIILLTGIFFELSKNKTGWIAIGAFAFIVVVSLYHYTALPEIYSRRDMRTALSDYVLKELHENDKLIAYDMRKTQPNYYKFLDKDVDYVNIIRDKPKNASLKEYIKHIESSTSGKILLISRETIRNMVDSDGIVMNVLTQRRHWKRKMFGRNLSLYIFASRQPAG